MIQRKIANWLKGLDIVLFIMVLSLLIFLTYVRLQRPELIDFLNDSSVGFIAFSCFTGICVFIVLIEFWKICTQIGNDNSFSIENSKAFHNMTICGIVAAVIFACKIVSLIITSNFTLLYMMLILVEIVLSVMFAILAEAMSKLVLNAYEVKHENELTI